MIQAKSTIKLNMAKINQLTDAAITALEQTGDALLGDVYSEQVIPFDTGTLRDNTFCDDSQSKKGVVTIVSSTPYARRLYYHPEYNFQTTYSANARGKWLDPWMEGGEKASFAPDIYKKLYRRLTGV